MLGGGSSLFVGDRALVLLQHTKLIHRTYSHAAIICVCVCVYVLYSGSSVLPVIPS